MFDTDALSGAWTEDSAGIYKDAGQVGGDIQISESYLRSFARRNEDGTFTVVDFYAYRAQEDGSGTVVPAQARKGQWVQVMCQASTCTDPNDVGDTEISAEIRYWDGLGDETDGPEQVCAALGVEDVRALEESL